MAPLDLNLFTIFVGGAAGVALLTATCVLFIQAGFNRLDKTIYRVANLQRREIDATLDDHGKRIMRLEWTLLGVTIEGPETPKQ